MSSALAPPPIDDFHPPYELGAFGCAAFGTWTGAPVPPPTSGQLGFVPLRWLGRSLGAALVLRYDRPTAEYPVEYSEVILAHIGRLQGRLAVMPFDLVLDDAFYVEAGIRYYHLPKRLDATLRLQLDGDPAARPVRMTASGSDLRFEAELAPVALPVVSGAAAAIVRAFTGRVPVVGAASSPALCATIGLVADSRPVYAGRGLQLAVAGRTLRPLAALFWRSLEVTVGVPRPL